MNKFLIPFIFVILIGAIMGGWYFKKTTENEEELSPSQKKSEKTASPSSQPIMETIIFETRDGVTISGLYWRSQVFSAPAVLLLHMMPTTKESWVNFAQKLADAGFGVLAIDLRGHGESVQQAIPSETRILNYKNFSDPDHQRSIFDVEAAVAFLKSEGVSAIHVGGASIGANLALQYLAEHPKTKSAFLLSPGLDYRGIKTEKFAAGLHTGQAVYYIAADDDPYSAETVQALHQKTADGITKEVKIFKRAGHGTDMLSAHPELMEELILWLKSL